MWYEWDSLESFNVWHDALCISLGYPLTPVNQATGEPDDNAQKVVAYTEAIKVNDKWIAFVEEQEASGLIQTNLRPITPPRL